MPTFYDHQQNSRSRTGRLSLLFAAAIIAVWLTLTLLISDLTYAMIWGIMCLQVGAEKATEQIGSFWEFPATIPVGILCGLTIIVTSVWKLHQLKVGGGSLIAEQLGGRRLQLDEVTGDDQRLINVVQEMAIASNLPLPAVYVLDREQGINAFAAGYHVSDAVIAVTAGCVKRLNREQLQAVVAHEFSHVVNGDMKLNLYTTGILHGILVFDAMGQSMLKDAENGGEFQDAWGNRSSRPVVLLLLVGLLLTIVGIVGAFVGGLIQAAISREREYLADASAVEFTRNAPSLASALKVIAGYQYGSRIQHSAVSEYRHFFFDQPIDRYFNFLSTHPPIGFRIRKLEPEWDGVPEFQSSEAEIKVDFALAKELGVLGFNKPTNSQSNVLNAGRQCALDGSSDSQSVCDDMFKPLSFGTVDSKDILFRESVHDELPVAVKATLDHPAGLAASMVTVFAVANPDPVIKAVSQVDSELADIVLLLLPEASKRDSAGQILILDEVMHRLQDASTDELRRVCECSRVLFNVSLDSDYTALRWATARMLARVISERKGTRASKVKFACVEDVRTECEIILSALVYAGASAGPMANYSFMRAASHLEMSDLQLINLEHCGLKNIDKAVDVLACGTSEIKLRLLKCCSASCSADGEISIREAAVIRALCCALGFPAARLLPGQPVLPGKSF